MDTLENAKEKRLRKREKFVLRSATNFNMTNQQYAKVFHLLIV